MIGLCHTAEARPLTVADAIQTKRIMGGARQATRSADGAIVVRDQDVAVSPDGRRYAALLVSGDIARNGIWMEVFTGSLDSVDAAKRSQVVAKLFSHGYGKGGLGAARIFMAHFNPLHWIDEERVAFFFDGENGEAQPHAVNVRTGKVEQLTRHPTAVLSFQVAKSGAVVYMARFPRERSRATELYERGFTVVNSDLYSVLKGDIDGYSTLDEYWNTEWLYLPAGAHAPTKIVLARRDHELYGALFRPQFSPDGRYMVLDGTPDVLLPEWDGYTQEPVRDMLAEARRSRTDFLARQLRQLFLADLTTGRTRPLGPVPKSVFLWDAAWSPDSRSIILPSTFLPNDHISELGVEGRALAEVDIASGQWNVLPLSADEARKGVLAPRWRTNDSVEVLAGSRVLRFAKVQGQWRLSSVADSPEAAESAAQVRMEVRQDLNTPPKLYAVDIATGKAEVVLDPNPQLGTELALGKTEHISWISEGRTWNGRLFLPVDYQPERRYALVIQTHGLSPPSRFSLYGKELGTVGVGPGYSIYAAQPLANRHIAVLQVEDKSIRGIVGTPQEPAAYMRAYEAAIETLVRRGIIDRTRVGILGFSRTGYHVQYALSHSDFPYAAAITSDNVTYGYLEAMTAWSDGATRNVGAEPVGEGLHTWLRHSPAFNAHKVRTPLRLTSESGLRAVMTNWELFQALRILKRPVELYVVPHIDRGTHGVMNPRQLLAVADGTVDWFDFWLNGHRDSDPAKEGQYERWEGLRQIQRSVAAQ